MIKRKIKIMYEGVSDNFGGIETYIYNLYKNMDHDKFEISFLTYKNLKISFLDEYRKDNVKIFEVENRKKNYFKYLKDLKKIYTENDFDYIHINMMSYSVFERITYACKYSNAKIILHSHTSSSRYLRKDRTFYIDKIGRVFVKKYIDKVLRVACSENAGQYMFPKKNFIIFNNGIDFEKYKFKKEYRYEIRNELKIKEHVQVMGITARQDPVKNVMFLTDIFNEYQKLNRDCVLVMTGYGPLMQKMQEKINDLGLKNKVFLLGKREDAYKIYSAYDFYILPSLYEGFSISLVEAQINGLKCYTSNGVDEKTNLSGNVEFISLDKSAKEWADIIYKSNNIRDEKVLNKIPEDFNAKNSYKKVYDFYLNNL